MARRRIVPHQRVETIYDLDLDRLHESGIRYLMIDVDNTLVPTGASDIPDALRRWMDGAKEMFSVCLLSNSKRKRILIAGPPVWGGGFLLLHETYGTGVQESGAHKLGVTDPSIPYAS